jgi:hypothetical protein
MIGEMDESVAAAKPAFVDVGWGRRVWSSARIVPTGMTTSSLANAPQAELSKIKVSAPSRNWREYLVISQASSKIIPLKASV